MARKTRKKASRAPPVMTIPQVRRSFEHMEQLLEECSSLSRADQVARLRKEWRKVFHRELSKASAEEFVAYRAEQAATTPHRRRRYRTTRRHGGMASVEHQTRPGMYLAPGQIPNENGSLPLSSGAPSAFGSFTEYISKGFGITVPEPAQQLDPVKGQAQWPVPMKGGAGFMDNMGAVYRQAMMRPIGPSAPTSVMSDLQNIAYGSTVGISPSVPQRTPDYQLGKVYSGPL